MTSDKKTAIPIATTGDIVTNFLVAGSSIDIGTSAQQNFFRLRLG